MHLLIFEIKLSFETLFRVVLAISLEFYKNLSFLHLNYFLFQIPWAFISIFEGLSHKRVYCLKVETKFILKVYLGVD